MAGVTTRPGQAWPTHLIGLLGPALAAVVTVWKFDGREGLANLWDRSTRWQVNKIWYLVLLATAAMMVIPVFLDEKLVFNVFTTYSGAGTWGVWTILYVLVLNGFGEEIGWRGFLLAELLPKYSLLSSALRVWIVWGLWHLPLFFVVENFKDLGIGGTIGWAMGLLSGTIWLSWLYRSSSSSIFIVALWHTIFNFTTATAATSGITAAISSTLVMVASVVIAVLKQSRLQPVE